MVTGDGNGTSHIILNVCTFYHPPPCAVRVACDGVIETLGRLTVAGPNGVPYPGPFTAHPKVDPVTGEMFFFGYSFDAQPYVRAGLMAADGAVVKQVRARRALGI